MILNLSVVRVKEIVNYSDILLFLILFFMEHSKLSMVADIVFTMCLLLFVVSFFSGKTAAFVCLGLACIGQAEVLLISFVQHRSLNLRVFFFMLWMLFLGRICHLADFDTVAIYLFFGVLIAGCFLVFRFVVYMNKYCRQDMDKYLDS